MRLEVEGACKSTRARRTRILLTRIDIWCVVPRRDGRDERAVVIPRDIGCCDNRRVDLRLTSGHVLGSDGASIDEIGVKVSGGGWGCRIIRG